MKKALFISGLGTAVFLLASCNWTIPQTVSVKTDATYELGLGDGITKTIEDGSKFSDLDIRQSIEDGMGSDDGSSEVYDYFPDSADADLQQYLMLRPVYKFSLGLSNFSEAITAASSLGKSTVNLNVDYKSTTALGVNLNSVLGSFDTFGEGFAKNLKIGKVPIYMVAEKTSAAYDSAALTSSAYIYYGKKADDDTVAQCGDTKVTVLEDGSKLGFVTLPDLEADDNKLVTKNIETIFNGTKAAKSEIAEIINEKVDDEEAELYLDLNIGAITLSSELAKSATAPIEFTIYVYIDIPLSFTLEKDAEMEIIKSDSDSTASEEGGDENSPDSSNSFLDVIDSGYLKITPTQLPFTVTSMDIILGIGSVNITVPIGNINEEKQVTITKSQFTKIKDSLSSSSASPDLTIKIGKGILQMPREIGFLANMTVGIVTDGEIQVYPSSL